MNTREAMRALLDGKRIVSQHGRVLALAENGTLHWDNGREGALGNHVWEVYEEPNPHTKGTFAWAREEAKRGNCVVCPSVSKDFRFYHRSFTNRSPWSLDYFDATDWEVVS